MEWSKIKNIILTILLTVNVILLIVVGKREYDTASYVASARRSAVAVLACDGINVTGELPEEMTLRTLQLNWVRQEETEQLQAEALLGAATTRTDDGGGTSTTYHAPNGSVTFSSDGKFIAELNEGVWSTRTENAVRHGQNCLEKLGFDGVLEGSTRAVLPDLDLGKAADTLTLTYYQCYEKAPIFTCKAVLTYCNGSLRLIEGDRVSGQVASAGEETPLTVPTVLLQFRSEMKKSGYVCSQITGMTAGYESTGQQRLTPVWAITTDSKITYYLNGITGVLSHG